jgi:hypothetical protein
LKLALDAALKQKRTAVTILTNSRGVPRTEDGFRTSWGQAFDKTSLGDQQDVQFSNQYPIREAINSRDTDRSEHIAEAREISSFECAVCGETIENWNSAWVPRYRFIACPAKTPND